MTLRDALRGTTILAPLALDQTDLVEGRSAATARAATSPRTTRCSRASPSPWT